MKMQSAKFEYGASASRPRATSGEPAGWFDAVAAWLETARQRRAARREYEEELYRLDWWRAH